MTKFLNEETKDIFGGSFHVCEDPLEAANKIMKLLNEDRKRLGIDKKAERKLFDMKDRRELDV